MVVPVVESPQSATLTVADAVREALFRHPLVLAAAKELEGARAVAAASGALEPPTILVSPAIASGINGTTEELLATQPLGLNGSRTERRRGANAQVVAGEARLRAVRATVAAAVGEAVVILDRDRRLLALAREDLSDADRIDAAAARQIELGSRPGIDRSSTRLELQRATRAVVAAEAAVASAEIRLGALLGRPAGAGIGPVGTGFPDAAVPDADSSVAAAMTARPELAVAGAETAMAMAERRGLLADGRPDLAPQFRAQQFLSRPATSRDTGFSVAIRLPVLDWGTRRAALRQSELNVAAIGARGADVARTVAEEVRRAVVRWSAAATTLAAFAPSLEEADRLRRALRIGFEEGSLSLPAWIEGRRAWYSTRADHATALAELSLARIEWVRATGTGSGSELSR